MNPDPRHDHLGVLLTAYADGSLPEDGCAFLEQQLEAHPELRDRLGEIRAAQEVLRANLPAAPASLTEDRRITVMAAAQVRPPRRMWSWRPLALVAAACLVVALSVTLTSTTNSQAPTEGRGRPIEGSQFSSNFDGETHNEDGKPAPGPTWAMTTPVATAKPGAPAVEESKPGRLDGLRGKAVADATLDGRTAADKPMGGVTGTGSAGLPMELYPKGQLAAAAPVAPPASTPQPGSPALDVGRTTGGKEMAAAESSVALRRQSKDDGLKSKPDSAGYASGESLSQVAAAEQEVSGKEQSYRNVLKNVDQRRTNKVQARLPELARKSEESAQLAEQEQSSDSGGRYTFNEDIALSSQASAIWNGPQRQQVEQMDLAQAQQDMIDAPAALAFIPQNRVDLVEQLATNNLQMMQQRLMRNSQRSVLGDELIHRLNLPLIAAQNGENIAVPFRLLVDPNLEVRVSQASQTAQPGESVLNLCTSNRLQVVPMPGGFEIQAAHKPLDPTATFGWLPEDLRSAFGSAPMQAVVEEPQQTFAIDASISSFEIARAAIAAGRLPDPAQIEPQHLYNAVPADYPAPSGDDAFQLYAEAGPSTFASGPLATRTALVAVGVVSRRAAADERLPLDLVVALDTSGSMGRPGGLARARAGLDALLPQLDARDRVAVVAFGDVARIVQPALRGDQQSRLSQAMASVQPAGATNLADGLALACQVAGELATPGRTCRVLLATDGAALAGEAAPAAEAAVTRWRGRGVSLLVVGCADEGYDGAALERLAQRGDGEHHAVTSDQAARELFATRLLPSRLAILARDAKVQVTWNPERVSYARLIGFERRRLANEQFRDNSVDAGELAQDAQATALFEIVLTDRGSGALGTAAVRYHDTRLDRVVELSRPLPGGLIATTASPRLRLLACAAELGETMQCGWWRNVRGPSDGRLGSELARLDAPFARVLEQMDRRFRELESQDAKP